MIKTSNPSIESQATSYIFIVPKTHTMDNVINLFLNQKSLILTINEFHLSTNVTNTPLMTIKCIQSLQRNTIYSLSLSNSDMHTFTQGIILLISYQCFVEPKRSSIPTKNASNNLKRITNSPLVFIYIREKKNVFDL